MLDMIMSLCNPSVLIRDEDGDRRLQKACRLV